MPMTQGFWGSGSMLLRKILKFKILKLPKIHRNCQSYHHHVILYHFKCFTISPGGSFLAPVGGGGGEGVSAHASAYGPGLTVSIKNIVT